MNWSPADNGEQTCREVWRERTQRRAVALFIVCDWCFYSLHSFLNWSIQSPNSENHNWVLIIHFNQNHQTVKIKSDLIILKNTTKNNSIFRQSTSSETDNIRRLTGFQGCRFVHLYQPHSLCLSYLKPSPSSMEETTNWALALELLLMSLIFSLQIGMQNSSLSLSKFSSFFLLNYHI